jgi:hypothetical protein
MADYVRQADESRADTTSKSTRATRFLNVDLEVRSRHDLSEMAEAFEGFAVKAIAVYTQTCAIVAADAPELSSRYAHVPPILADLLQRLGLTREATAALDALSDRGLEKQRPS